MTDTEEIIKKREKEIKKTNEKFEFNVKAGKANQQTGEANPVSKSTAEVVVKDVDIPFTSALLLTLKFFFAGLIIALPIWLIFFVIMTS